MTFSVSPDFSTELALQRAKKDLKLLFVYFLNKECVPMICDLLNDNCEEKKIVDEVVDYLCKRLNVCFLLSDEYKMISLLIDYIKN